MRTLDQDDRIQLWKNYGKFVKPASANENINSNAPTLSGLKHQKKRTKDIKNKMND